MRTFNILCIGDSHTAGFPCYDPLMGGDPESSYQFWLEKELSNINPGVHYSLMNEGMCGDSSRGIVMRLFSLLQIAQYDLVILAGGTNDLGVLSETQITINLKQGYQACINQQVPLIAPCLPPLCFSEYASLVTTINNEIKIFIEQFEDAYFADWYSALKDGHGFLADTYNSGDGVHLSVAGYKCIGVLMAPLINLACK